MKITFVNHASFWLESKRAVLLCDPWTSGKVFNDGWALLSPSAKIPFERLDHIFVSHEHPDHFHLPTLRAIPEADRRRIVVLYQKHSSTRLVDAFRSLGFARIEELPLYRWKMIAPDFEILCGSVGAMDSFLAIRTEGECVLNMNDCFCNAAQIKYIQRLVKRVSLLFTQFSFANWIGNHADETDAAEMQLKLLRLQIETFRPEFTIPFASFIYFCNQENSWMNQLAITPDRIAAMNLPGVNFMYPGDEWDANVRKFESKAAATRYMLDIEKLVIDPMPPSIPEETIREAAVKLLKALHKRFGRMLTGRMEPFEIYLHDLNRIMKVVPKTAECEICEATPETAARARYVMCSQVAWYTFAHTWGWGTLLVSAMFEDRDFKEKGEQDLFKRSVTALSTDILSFRNPTHARRMVEFFWGKKFELLYRLRGAPSIQMPAPAGNR
ncbi:MAG: MBL fold metallo-hydrolase [Candidatus Acidiferrales bacterium]